MLARAAGPVDWAYSILLLAVGIALVVLAESPAGLLLMVAGGGSLAVRLGRAFLGTPPAVIQQNVQGVVGLSGFLVVCVVVLASADLETTAQRVLGGVLGLLALGALYALIFNVQVARATLLLRIAGEGELAVGPRAPDRIWWRAGYVIATDGREVAIATLPLLGTPKLLAAVATDATTASVEGGRRSTAVLRIKTETDEWVMTGNKSAVNAVGRCLGVRGLA